MNNLTAKIPALFLIAALFCFLMPFVDLSCKKQNLVSLTGLELMTGKTIADAQIYGQEHSRTHSHPLVILASLSAVLGLFFSFGKTSLSRLIAFVFCIAGFSLLLAFKIKLDINIAEKAEEMLLLDWRYGFWLCCILFILAAVSCLVAYFSKRKKIAVSGAMISCFVILQMLFFYGCENNSPKVDTFEKGATSNGSVDLGKKTTVVPIVNKQELPKNIEIVDRRHSKARPVVYSLLAILDDDLELFKFSFVAKRVQGVKDEELIAAMKTNWWTESSDCPEQNSLININKWKFIIWNKYGLDYIKVCTCDEKSCLITKVIKEGNVWKIND